MEYHLVKQLLLQSLEMIEGVNPSASNSVLQQQTFGAQCLSIGMLDHGRPADWIGSLERGRLLQALEVECHRFWKRHSDVVAAAFEGCEVPQ